MFIYLLLLFVLLFFSFLEFFEVSISNKITFFLCSVLIVFVSGFRYGLETDYWSYFNIYKGIRNTENIEKGYLFYSGIIKVITQNFNYFLVSIALFFLGLKCHIFEKFKHPFLAMTVYFLKFFVLLELNVVRQGIAITFILYAIFFLKNGKICLAALFVFIASSFHLSSIIFLVIFPLRKMKWNIKKILFCILGFVIFRVFVLSVLINLLSPLIGMFSGSFLANGLKYIFANSIPSSSILISIIRLLIPSICIYNLLKNTDDLFYFNVYFIGVWINIIFMGMDTIGYRLALIFYSSESFALSQGLKKNYKSLCFIIPIIILDVISFFSILKGSGSAIPYRCFWFIDPNSIIQ